MSKGRDESGQAAAGENQPPAEQEQAAEFFRGLHLPQGCVASARALEIAEGVAEDQLAVLAGAIGAMAINSNWHLGDLLVYAARHGQKRVCREVTKLLRKRSGSGVRTIKQVATRFPAAGREIDLSWTHYRAVATRLLGFPEEGAADFAPRALEWRSRALAWLETALLEQLSSDDLAARIVAAREERGGAVLAALRQSRTAIEKWRDRFLLVKADPAAVAGSELLRIRSALEDGLGHVAELLSETIAPEPPVQRRCRPWLQAMGGAAALLFATFASAGLYERHFVALHAPLTVPWPSEPALGATALTQQQAKQTRKPAPAVAVSNNSAVTLTLIDGDAAEAAVSSRRRHLATFEPVLPIVFEEARAGRSRRSK